MRWPSLLILLLVLNTHARAQERCAETLVTANTLYEQGKLKEAIELARHCTGSDQIIERWQAFKLLAMAYLANQQSAEALQATEEMLALNPTYRPSSLKDPSELIRLIKSITVLPKFSLGLAVSAGTNTSIVRIKKGYALGDYTKHYSSKSGLQFGTNVGFYLNPRVVLDLGFLVTNKTYEIDYKPANWNVKIKENLNYLETPLSAKFIFRPRKKFRAFVQGGIYCGYLLYDHNDYRATFLPENKTFSLSKLSALDRRNRWNYGLMAGTGCYYKLNSGHVSLQAGYFGSLKNINTTDQRFSNTALMYTYFYVDDDLVLDNVTVSLGYTLYLNYRVYKPKGK